jgi:hypothetical protein
VAIARREGRLHRGINRTPFDQRLVQRCAVVGNVRNGVGTAGGDHLEPVRDNWAIGNRGHIPLA